MHTSAEVTLKKRKTQSEESEEILEDQTMVMERKVLQVSGHKGIDQKSDFSETLSNE